ncbi:kinase-like domain-containing protein [Mycena epipterygia]|nr:kinase-like domain-containing protein [Mycena epipterygia]
MSSENVVSGILGSLKCRKILLELSSELGLDNDPNLRKALRTDRERIAALLVSIFDSQSVEDVVLCLEDDSAQCFLDVVLDILDSGFLITPEHSRRARRIIRKLSESCDKLPSALFITGVSGRKEYASCGGSYGDIYRVSYGDKNVALKRMRCFLQHSDSDLRRIRSKFYREALVWKDLHHPHILPFIGIDRENFPPLMCMVSPWMEHGTILKFLDVHGRGNVDRLLLEIAQGLQYLHSCNIVHGDLKGANILINEDWSACLADFGLSIFSDATATSTRAGTIYWMAPELIAPERFKRSFARTTASDVYAFGCSKAMLKVIDGARVERPSGTPAMSDMVWDIVVTCWDENPANRPSAEVVVQMFKKSAKSGPVPAEDDHENISMYHDVRRRGICGVATVQRRLADRRSDQSHSPTLWSSLLQEAGFSDDEIAVAADLPQSTLLRPTLPANKQPHARARMMFTTDIIEPVSPDDAPEDDEYHSGRVAAPVEDFIEDDGDEKPHLYAGRVSAIVVPLEITEGESDGSPLRARDGNDVVKGRRVLVAIKSVALLPGGSAKLADVQRECRLLSGLRCEQVLGMDALWIRMELMERSLADVVGLVDEGLRLQEPRMMAQFASDMLQALDHLQKHNIAHRDLRGQLAAQRGSDFSNAVLVTPETPLFTDLAGIIYWQAPEVRSGAYDPLKIDVWSVGATVWELAEAAPPFSDTQQPAERWPAMSQPALCLPAFHEFLRLCYEPATLRPTPGALLEDIFIQEACRRPVIVQLLSCCMAIEQALQAGDALPESPA